MIKFKNKNGDRVIAIMDDSDEEPKFVITEKQIQDLLEEKKEEIENVE